LAPVDAAGEATPEYTAALAEVTKVTAEFETITAEVAKKEAAF
jgi:hypothetical protein